MQQDTEILPRFQFFKNRLHLAKALICMTPMNTP